MHAWPTNGLTVFPWPSCSSSCSLLMVAARARTRSTSPPHAALPGGKCSMRGGTQVMGPSSHTSVGTGIDHMIMQTLCTCKRASKPVRTACVCVFGGGGVAHSTSAPGWKILGCSEYGFGPDDDQTNLWRALGSL